jgi:hypothetical protein
MAKFLKLSVILFLFTLLTNQLIAQGYWTPLTYLSPDPNGGVMVQLSNGTVLVKTSSGGGDGIGNIWNILTPDYDGTYVGATWTTATPMADTRLYFSSRLLQDGRLYVAGGEYGTGPGTCEIYDPIADTWTSVTAGLAGTDQILDANSELLPDGKVLQAIVYSSVLGYNGVKIFNPATNSFSPAPSTLGSGDESSWVLLPDSSILFMEIGSATSERYIPSLNQWITDDTLPATIYDMYTSEVGPGFLLPDGRAFFIGGIHKTALYTPSGDTTAGTWTMGPDIPLNLGSNDGAGAMMPDGKVLFCAATENIGPLISDEYLPPTYFFEFDYNTNTIAPIYAPGGGDSLYIPSYYTNMLVLPDGNILYASQGDSQYWLYTPAGPQLAAGKPTINTVTPISCHQYKITGTNFNGISEGAGYGDDWQMATNFPLVRLTQGVNAYYARTSNWNRTGVAYGGLPDTAIFDLPVGLPAGSFTLEVIANGIHSNGFSFTPCSDAGITNNTSEKTDIKVFPNPTSNEVNIVCWSAYEENTTVKIIDISGRIVKTEIVNLVPGKNTKTLQVSSLAAGVYTIVMDGNKKMNAKLIIK